MFIAAERDYKMMHCKKKEEKKPLKAPPHLPQGVKSGTVLMRRLTRVKFLSVCVRAQFSPGL